MIKHISNYEISQILNEMAILYEMDDVQFKPAAYENAARDIEGLEQEVVDIYKEGGFKALKQLPSVGEGIAHHIESILKTGTFPEYKKYKKKIPVKLNELMSIGGLGPKNIKTLYKKLKIKTLKDLERAAKTGKIANLAGFGKKSQDNILKGVAFQKRGVGRFLIGYVDPLVQSIEERIKKIPGVGQITTAGSYRRRQETIGDIDVLVTAKNNNRVMEVFVKMPEVSRVLAHGPTKSMVRLKNGIQADVRVVPKQSYGAALQYFTGDKAHNVELRKIAIKKGLKLNEYGLFKGKRRVAGKTEQEVYKKLELQCMEPEIRTNTGELTAARKNKLPKLIPYGSIRGDLQIQTNWTDGQHSIEQMARAAKDAGLEYIAITDHTKALAMTGGLDERGLARQGKAIDKLNRKLKKFRILKSSEVDVLRNGKLDIKDEALKKLDLVCIAVHSLFNLSEKEQTERIIQAMKNPHVNILFHPTGRIIQKRPAYVLDMDKIIRAAKQYGVALEISALPDRLDLKDTHIRQAVEYGAKLVIDSDAHNADHFKYLDLGIAQARRGWAAKADVLNTLPCDEFLKRIKGLKRK